jgi:hypothetical protein
MGIIPAIEGCEENGGRGNETVAGVEGIESSCRPRPRTDTTPVTAPTMISPCAETIVIEIRSGLFDTR